MSNLTTLMLMLNVHKLGGRTTRITGGVSRPVDAIVGRFM
jgi:hypothetical protein